MLLMGLVRSQTVDPALDRKVKRQKKTNDGGQSAVLDQLDMKMCCAFCHSKETEGSGPLVSYAQGKKQGTWLTLPILYMFMKNACNGLQRFTFLTMELSRTWSRKSQGQTG